MALPLQAGQRWRCEAEAFVIETTTKADKGKKFSGMKTFTVYEVKSSVCCKRVVSVAASCCPASPFPSPLCLPLLFLHGCCCETTSATRSAPRAYSCDPPPQAYERKVERRFKHFAWLHSRLTEQFPCVIIPPIPEKQVQGRFDGDFIESRRQKLERFLNRVARHPVMGSSSVFRHFLTVGDHKAWKSGKRDAEQAAHNSKFLADVQIEEPTPSNA